MNENDHEGLKNLLRQAMPPVGRDGEPAHDLWPAMLRRLESEPVAIPWFDWALGTALLGAMAMFPAAIPLLLYYL